MDQMDNGEGCGGDTAYISSSLQEPWKKKPRDVSPSAEPPANANAGLEEEFVKDAGGHDEEVNPSVLQWALCTHSHCNANAAATCFEMYVPFMCFFKGETDRLLAGNMRFTAVVATTE